MKGNLHTPDPSQGTFVPAQGSITCATTGRLNTSLLTVAQNQMQAAAKGKGSKGSFTAGTSATATATATAAATAAAAADWQQRASFWPFFC